MKPEVGGSRFPAFIRTKDIEMDLAEKHPMGASTSCLCCLAMSENGVRVFSCEL